MKTYDLLYSFQKVPHSFFNFFIWLFFFFYLRNPYQQSFAKLNSFYNVLHHWFDELKKMIYRFNSSSGMCVNLEAYENIACFHKTNGLFQTVQLGSICYLFVWISFFACVTINHSASFFFFCTVYSKIYCFLVSRTLSKLLIVLFYSNIYRIYIVIYT